MIINDENLQNAQEIMLEILIEVDRICEKYKIEYWLDSGTLLGAVRHKGFIPWDDDLDIAMKIEDYDRFSKVVQDELKKSMYFQNCDVDYSFPYDFIKIRSSKGKIVEKHENGKDVDYNQGIFIDIFPMVALKPSYLNEILYKGNLLLIKLFSYKYLNILSISRYFVSLSSSFHVGWEETSNKVLYGGHMPFLPFCVEVKDIFPLEKIVFKNKSFSSPRNTYRYLQSLYGDDYMTLPPENKRKTHAHSIEIF